MPACPAAKLPTPHPPCYRQPMQSLPSIPAHWDVEADVVVVGFGAAGMAAAVTAHDLGAEVVILEKAPEGQEGGNTRVAGQGYLNTSAVEPAIDYLTALCGPYTVPEPMVRVWARGDVPEQRLAREPRLRPAGASASARRDRVPRPPRAPTACTSFMTARPTATPTPGSGSSAGEATADPGAV